MSESTNWREIYRQIAESDLHIVSKINSYNLTSYLEELYLQNQKLREKIEELKNDVEILKSYAWNNE